MSNFHLTCVSEAVSPITHMSGRVGNEAVVNRQTVVTSDGIRHVPVLSGNALRHRTVREPAARWLIDRYQLKGKLSIEQLNFLLHGGSLTEKGGRVRLASQAESTRVFPMLRLLGCALPYQIQPGCLQVDQGTLLCRENASRLNHVIPYEFPTKRLRAAVSFVRPYTYYRHDASKTAPDLISEENAEVDYEGMIFSGQSIAPGAVFVHGYHISHPDDLTIGCLLHSLSLWNASGATIGGQSARGHGKLRTHIVYPDGFDAESAISEYVSYADSVAEDAVAFLETMGRTEPPKKKATKKKSAKEAEKEVVS